MQPPIQTGSDAIEMLKGYNNTVFGKKSIEDPSKCKKRKRRDDGDHLPYN